jgi:hypothetical protein
MTEDCSEFHGFFIAARGLVLCEKNSRSLVCACEIRDATVVNQKSYGRSHEKHKIYERGTDGSTRFQEGC